MTPSPFALRPDRSGRARPRGRRRRSWVHQGSAVLVLGLSGCGGAGSPSAAVAPLADPVSSLEELSFRTTVDGPTRIFFDWSLTEEGVRVNGRGVARVEPPDRARLDLFLSNGEAVAGAILVGDDLALPVSLPDDILPPPELLWGTVGTVRLGSGARVIRGDTLEDGGTRLAARLPDDQMVSYDVFQGRVRRIEQMTQGGTVIKTLVTSFEGEGSVPVQATYRDLTAFRELILKRDRMESVDGFPADIWHY